MLPFKRIREVQKFKNSQVKITVGMVLVSKIFESKGYSSPVMRSCLPVSDFEYSSSSLELEGFLKLMDGRTKQQRTSESIYHILTRLIQTQA